MRQVNEKTCFFAYTTNIGVEGAIGSTVDRGHLRSKLSQERPPTTSGTFFREGLIGYENISMTIPPYTRNASVIIYKPCFGRVIPPQLLIQEEQLSVKGEQMYTRQW